MRHTILCFAAALTLAGLSIVPASAQFLPDPDYPDARLNLWQEETVSRIREEDRELFLKTRPTDKPLAEWTQRDYARFRFRYRSWLGYRERISGEGRATGTIIGYLIYHNSDSIEALETDIFIELLTRDGGGGDGEGDGGGDD